MASKPGVVDAAVSAHPGFLVSPVLNLAQRQALRNVGHQLCYAQLVAYFMCFLLWPPRGLQLESTG
jgi:hypothetical protein